MSRLTGTCATVYSSAASEVYKRQGTHNIGASARMIAYDDADVMVCGGAEMATTPLGLGGFGAARALSTRNDDPLAASRPWDADRDGFVLGDCACYLYTSSSPRDS